MKINPFVAFRVPIELSSPQDLAVVTERKFVEGAFAKLPSVEACHRRS